MKRFSLLLPHGFRLPGFVLLIAGSVFGIMHFMFDIKPKFLTMKVYAIYSEYLGDKYFHFIRDNMSEELVGVLMVLGIWLVALSREKVETEEMAAARSQAFVISGYLQLFLLVFALLLTYGIAFLYMSMLYLILPPALYYIIFKIIAGRNTEVPQ